MKYIRDYEKFKESKVISMEFSGIEELLESLNVWHDALLSSINAEELDIFDTLKITKEVFGNDVDIDFLSTSPDFVNTLTSLSLKKSETNNSEDYETFINKPCKFMFIFNIDSNELENPEYLLFQTWNETLNRWEGSKLYKINDNIKRFYDKLTSRTIEIIDGDENYIYQTTNGNEWELQDRRKANDTYKETFRKEELKEILDKRGVSVNII
jgi:hypothetical protein